MVCLVICGVPGTGKSTLVQKLKSTRELKDFTVINLSKLAVDNNFTEGYDDQLETHIIDEEKVALELKKVLRSGGIQANAIIETIHPSLVPPKLVSLVYICQTSTSILYDRLKERNYNELKISNNIESEIFQIIHEEAVETFEPQLVTKLTNDSESDLEKNVSLVVEKVKNLNL